MKKVDVKVKGKRPLLFHAFKVEAISNTSKVKSGSAGNDPEEWKNSVLEMNGQLFLPSSYWQSCMKAACAYTKAGRGSIQKSFIGCTGILTEQSLIDRHLPKGWEKLDIKDAPKDASLPVYIDIRGVTNPNSKGKNIRYRVACSPGWTTEYSFYFDDKILSQSQIRKVIEDAGKMVGVGSARTLGYGRFSVEDCQISDYED